MKKIHNFLFDLDGTLTDPGLGITNSIIYALKKYGIEAGRSSLYRFIGPPLRETFMNHFGFDREKAEDAVRFYREYFEKNGMFENVLYPGIPELLSSLHSIGKRLMVATSKPEPYAVQILEHFRIADYFILITGSRMDGSMISKDELISYIINNTGSDPAETVMIGDRIYDIEGARSNGILSVGVKYGYADGDEMERAEPGFIVNDVAELASLLHNFA
ncbi:MAG TPA: HAD hydrolase-like protein [Spirochaetota bacterium]|nr:HAD hydrolase-like protein [Spirochaetota bacterium]